MVSRRFRRKETSRGSIAIHDIYDVFTLFQLFKVVELALELEIFQSLRNRSLTAVELAKKLGFDVYPAQILLNVLVSMGLLVKRRGVYSNSSSSEKHLARLPSEAIKAWTIEKDRSVKLWAYLLSRLRSKKPATTLDLSATSWIDTIKRDDQFARHFTILMHYSHIPIAQELAFALDLSKRRRLLDVGGGSGVMSIALGEANPKLECVIQDFPGVCEVAREFVARSSASGRVSTWCGDYNRSMPRGFDVVLMSDLGLVNEDSGAIMRLFRRARKSLVKGGLIVIVEDLLNRDKSSPLDAVLWSLHSFLECGSVSLNSYEDIIRLLRSSGFQELRHQYLRKSTCLIVGIKP